MVMNLCKSLFRQGYKVFLDNFYSSVPLFKELLKNGTTACGTILANRKGFPNVLKNIKTFTKKERGEMRWIREGGVAFGQ